MSKPSLIITLAWATSVTAATAVAQGNGAIGVGRAATSGMVWPLPPERPRISYAGSLSSEADLGKKPSGLARFRQFLSGVKPDIRHVQRPHDVFVDSRHRLYVTDGLQRSVMVFEPGSKQARDVGRDGPGRLVKPLGLGGDNHGNVYVADQGGKRIVVFDSTGAFRKAYGGETMLLNPVDVAVDTLTGHVYVADSYLHQVLVFRRDGSLLRRLGRDEGNLAEKLELLAASASTVRGADESHMAAGLGSDGEAKSMFGHSPKYMPEPRDLMQNRSASPGEFRYPAFLAIGRDGTLYVSDGMNFRVQAFDRDGKFLRAFGTLGDAPGMFARPKGLAVDSDGNIYVADAAFSNLQIFNPKGELLLPFAQMGRGAGELWLPIGIHIDADDHIYVSDRYNNRIQIFKYLNATGSVRPGRSQ